MVGPLEGRQGEQEQRFRNRTVFATGGTSGTGLATALTLSREGAKVALGTRDQKHFENVRRQFADPTYPIIGDIASPDWIIQQIYNLRRDGIVVTDVIHSAAGGLEPITASIGLQLGRWK